MDWQEWTGSPVPSKQIYLLTKYQAEELEEGSRAFARVYEYTPSPGLDLVRTNGVIRFIYTEGGSFFAEETTSQDYDFVSVHENQGWKFWALDLVDPKWIERIINALRVFTSYGCEWQYSLYERATQIAIVRSPNPEHVPHDKTPVTTMQDTIDWNICHITGQPHNFLDGSAQIPVIGRPYMSTGCRICTDCHGIYYAKPLPGE